MSQEQEPRIPPYTPREQSRLASFHNMLDKSMEIEQYLKTVPCVGWGRVENGQVVETYMEMDGRFIHTWEHVAQNLYETEFASNPRLKQAAHEIRDTLRAKYDPTPPAMSAEELNRIWEIEDELRSMQGGGE